MKSWVNLHDCVVDADEVGDEVEVSGDKHHEEENLGFPRDSRAAPGFPYLSKWTEFEFDRFRSTVISTVLIKQSMVC